VTKAHGQSKPRTSPARTGVRRKTAGASVPAGVSLRTCIGCRTTVNREELVRMVAGTDGQVLFDLAGGSFGRGAWTHATEDCLKKAARVMRGKGAVEDHAALVCALSDAANRRAKGLVTAAYRAGRLAIGSDASADEFAAGKAKLVVLSSDARAAARKQWLEDAVSAGVVWGWSNKVELGALVGRDELAVFAITDEGLARSLRQVLALTTPATSRLAAASLAVLRSSVATAAAGSHGLEDSEDG
jgi:predicted RNA-binding protein YlxR (DUF448 family)/ribosomal protein L30E